MQRWIVYETLLGEAKVQLNFSSVVQFCAQRERQEDIVKEQKGQ